jgi:hypothetical protein
LTPVPTQIGEGIAGDALVSFAWQACGWLDGAGKALAHAATSIGAGDGGDATGDGLTRAALDDVAALFTGKADALRAMLSEPRPSFAAPADALLSDWGLRFQVLLADVAAAHDVLQTLGFDTGSLPAFGDSPIDRAQPVLLPGWIIGTASVAQDFLASCSNGWLAAFPAYATVGVSAAALPEAEAAIGPLFSGAEEAGFGGALALTPDVDWLGPMLTVHDEIVGRSPVYQAYYDSLDALTFAGVDPLLDDWLTPLLPLDGLTPFTAASTLGNGIMPDIFSVSGAYDQG